MPYIYCITNLVNNKKYVGKTSLPDINQRFIQHKNDCNKSRNDNRPLYRAMRKYGKENFIIELIEQVDTEEEACLKEQYWIKQLNTYKYGYNITYGGDGKRLYDYKELAEAYKEFQNISKVCDKYHCDEQTVRKACREYNIEITRGRRKVKRTNLSTKEVKYYNSISEAALDIKDKEPETARKNISRSLNKNTLAYGYKYEYL